MLKCVRLTLAAASVIALSSQAAPFADVVVDYQSGTGFVPGYIHPSSALGQPGQPDTWGFAVDPFAPAWQTNQVVSLGTGGSLTVQFATPIANDPAHPFGIDFLVFGNTGFRVTNDMDANFNYIGTPATDGSLLGASAGAARVSVSQDGVHFYELNPSLTPVLDKLYPTDGAGNFQMAVDPSLRAADFAGKTLAQIQSLYGGSAGGAGFDLNWALDTNGLPVSLTSVNFVRVNVLSDKLEIDGFSTVPEPSTWALLSLALGLTWAMRRRR